MTRYLRRHHLFVYAGTALGVYLGGFVFEVDPAFAGWIFGAGTGMAGGAFLAAITSGEPLAGRTAQQGLAPASRSRRRAAPSWHERRNGP